MKDTTKEILAQLGWEKDGDFWKNKKYHHHDLPYLFTLELVQKIERLPAAGEMPLQEWVKTTGGDLVAIKSVDGEDFAHIDKEGHTQWTPIPSAVKITEKDLREWLPLS